MATLIIGTFSSRCSACGGNADPDEQRHIHGGPNSCWKRGSWLSDSNGCRAEFTKTTDPYGDHSPEVSA